MIETDEMIWILAGTRDAREIIRQLKKGSFSVVASAATDHGRELAKEAGANAVAGAMDADGMMEFIRDKGVSAAVDATHPFAVHASTNAMKACNELSVPYLRFERKRVETLGGGVHIVDDFREAGAKAAELGKVIFYAAGSRNMDVFLGACKGRRVFARVLKDTGTLERCIQLGLRREDVITANPPFSREENLVMFRECGADVLVTKESGAAGGLIEKLDASRELGMEVVVVKRPFLEYPKVSEDYGEVLEWVRKVLG